MFSCGQSHVRPLRADARASDESPIANQIPADFRTNCVITSIDSKTSGHVVPKSAAHCVGICGDTQYKARDYGWHATVNFERLNPGYDITRKSAGCAMDPAG